MTADRISQNISQTFLHHLIPESPTVRNASNRVNQKVSFPELNTFFVFFLKNKFFPKKCIFQLSNKNQFIQIKTICALSQRQVEYAGFHL